MKRQHQEQATIHIHPRHVAVAIPYRPPPLLTATSSSQSVEPPHQRGPEICLVSSRKHDGKFVLPKGGVEKGETSLQAAVREMWEEGERASASHNVLIQLLLIGDRKVAHLLSHPSAGLRPSVTQSKLPASTSSSFNIENTVADTKAHKQSPSQDPDSPAFVPRAIYTSHEILIDRGRTDDEGGEAADWPEAHERQRKWFPLQEALKQVAWRQDIAELLRRSSLARDLDGDSDHR